MVCHGIFWSCQYCDTAESILLGDIHIKLTVGINLVGTSFSFLIRGKNRAAPRKITARFISSEYFDPMSLLHAVIKLINNS